MRKIKRNLKKCLAVLLAVMMALSVLSVGAGAVDAAAKPRFIFDEDNDLCGLDFSDMIRDESTVNKGELLVDDEEPSNWVSGYFDADSGIVRFGAYDEKGVFHTDVISLYSINYTFTLYAKDGGKLFDDVAEFSFTMKELYDSFPDDFQINLVHPDVAVSKTDGEIVKEMTLNFNPEWTKSVNLLDAVDMTKEITLTVGVFVWEADFRAVPIRYSDGVLTVALYDGEKAGVPLHGVNVLVNGDADDELIVYRFWFKIPEGMFGYSNKTSAGSEKYYDQNEITGLPIRTLSKVSYPEWLTTAVYRVVEKIETDVKSQAILGAYIGLLIVFLTNPFWHIRLFRNIAKSAKDYGIDVSADVRLMVKYWLSELFNRT